MQLTHKIAMDATWKQREYFLRASGTSRHTYNWALAEWNRRYEAGGKPNVGELKKAYNAIYKTAFPWVAEVHRDCHSQPFVDLHNAFGNFFAKRAAKPMFKSKNKSRKSFYVSNDRLTIDKKRARLPVIGWVRLREELRFEGKINSARVVEKAGQWFLCVSVDLGDTVRLRTGNDIVGVDLGLKTLATLSTGETIENPRPLKKAQKKLKRTQRSLSRRVKGSKNRNKQRMKVARLHRRVRNVRHDVLHKLTTRLCRERGDDDKNTRSSSPPRKLPLMATAQSGEAPRRRSSRQNALPRSRYMCDLRQVADSRRRTSLCGSLVCAAGKGYTSRRRCGLARKGIGKNAGAAELPLPVYRKIAYPWGERITRSQNAAKQSTRIGRDSRQPRMGRSVHQLYETRHEQGGFYPYLLSDSGPRQTVVIEDLNVKGMVKNHCLAQSISDASFGLFRTLLNYKAKLYGNRIVVADRFYPSSKSCSSCGEIKISLSLSERTYRCDCGLEIDRDLNAAINLMQLGQALPEVTPVESHGARRSRNLTAATCGRT